MVDRGLFIRRNAISLKKQFPNAHKKHNYMFETRYMKCAKDQVQSDSDSESWILFLLLLLFQV